MKKLIILFLILPVVSFAQHRALRIDSLEVNDTNRTSFFDDYMSTYNNNVLWLDSCMVSQEAATAAGVTNRSGADSSAWICVDDGNGKMYFKATDADSGVIWCDADSFHIKSNNPIGMQTNVTVWGTMSAQTVTDRSEYCGEKEAIELLDKINLSLVDEFENMDDVFVLPYELRDKQYRSLSKCVSLLLAVAKSQQREIEDLKKSLKKAIKK